MFVLRRDIICLRGGVIFGVSKVDLKSIRSGKPKKAHVEFQNEKNIDQHPKFKVSFFPYFRN